MSRSTSVDTQMADPNGWVQSPPSVFVKVRGTSREAINGKLGLVLQYAADRQRYTVLLCEAPDEPVSLKADNLAACGLMEKGQAYYQMMRHNPDIQRQMRELSSQVRRRTGLTPEYALAGVLVALVAGWYALGFSRLLLLLTVLVMVLTVTGPDLVAGKDARTVLRNAPGRWRAVVREQVPVMGGKIAANKYYLGVFTAALGAFVVYSLLASPRRAVVPSAGAAPSRALPVSEDSKQRYYKLGFDDATNAEIYGKSLDGAGGPAGATTTDEYAWRNADTSGYDPTPIATPSKKSPLSISTALAAFAVYQTLHPLAVNAEGRYDLALFRANLVNLEVWKIGLMGFSVYRIVSAFL